MVMMSVLRGVFFARNKNIFVKYFFSSIFCAVVTTESVKVPSYDNVRADVPGPGPGQDTGAGKLNEDL